MPRKEKPLWRPDEPAREKAYQRLYRKHAELDNVMAILYRRVHDLEDRVKYLEDKEDGR